MTFFFVNVSINFDFVDSRFFFSRFAAWTTAQHTARYHMHGLKLKLPATKSTRAASINSPAREMLQAVAGALEGDSCEPVAVGNSAVQKILVDGAPPSGPLAQAIGITLYALDGGRDSRLDTRFQMWTRTVALGVAADDTLSVGAQQAQQPGVSHQAHEEWLRAMRPRVCEIKAKIAKHEESLEKIAALMWPALLLLHSTQAEFSTRQALFDGDGFGKVRMLRDVKYRLLPQFFQKHTVAEVEAGNRKELLLELFSERVMFWLTTAAAYPRLPSVGPVSPIPMPVDKLAEACQDMRRRLGLA